MKHKTKPYLGRIQEFGVAAYVKDLKARKLDAHVQQGHFIGYDSESKGYQIYWPTKRSITVEQNIVFNTNIVQPSDSSIMVLVGVQSEGEKDKVIQYPENHDENTKEVKNQTNGENKPKNGTSVEKEDLKSSNSIPFPSASDPTVEVENEDENLQQYGRGHQPRKQKGAYRYINEGLTAAIAHCEVEGEDNESPLEATDDVDEGFSKLLLDFALVGSIGPDPRMLDEALLLGDAPLRPTFPLIFLCHLCIFLLIIASPRQSALVAPIPESDDHVM